MKYFQLTVALLLVSAFPLHAARADLPGDTFNHHLIVSLGIGVGSLSPSQYNSYVDDFNRQAAASGSPLTGDAAHPGFELHVPVLLTYYFPYYVLFRTGVEAAYFFPSENLTNENATNYGGILEVPIEVGAHFAFLDNKFILELGLGPAIAAFTSAGLSGSASNGFTGTQLYGDPAVGFDDELKGQYFITPGFSLGIEMGYRILSSGALHDSSGAQAMVNGQTVQLDMSGFRAVLEFGFVVF